MIGAKRRMSVRFYNIYVYKTDLDQWIGKEYDDTMY